MPNHGHLLLPLSLSSSKVQAKLGGVMGQVSQGWGSQKPGALRNTGQDSLGNIGGNIEGNFGRNIGQSMWQPLPPPSVIPDRFHLRRQIRYVALNPCRKNLCRDPLEWYWSTYREFFGATANGKGNLYTLAMALGERPEGFLDRFHAYVSGDPSVAIQGTPCPRLIAPQRFAYKSIDEILAASAAAWRIQPSSVRNRGKLRATFIHLAHQQGWERRSRLLGEICAVSSRAVRFVLSQPIPESVKPAHLCLSDVRLRPPRVATAEFLPQSGKKRL